MQPARAPRAKEHTNNPVQRPNFRGQGTKQGTPWLDSRPQTPLVHRDNSGQENKRTSVDLARGKVSGGSRQKAVVGRTSLGGSLCREQRHPCPGELKFVINPDPTPVVKLKIPKKPGPQKSLQEVAAARATENLRRDKKGKVREQVDLFVVAQKAQVVLCYHKKGRQKENL